MVLGPGPTRGRRIAALGAPPPFGSMTQLATAVRAPTGLAFTVVLVCHVVAVLVVLGAVVAGAVAAARVLTANGELPSSVRTYFAPGGNWAGRVVYLVPVFGGVLIWMSGGAYRVGDAWVGWGIGLWFAATVLAEGVLWPAERRVRRSFAGTGRPDVPDAVRRPCRTICISAPGVVALLVAAMVVMVAKP